MKKRIIKNPTTKQYVFSETDNIVSLEEITPARFLRTTHKESVIRAKDYGKKGEPYKKYLKGAIIPPNVIGIKNVLLGKKKSKFGIPTPFLAFDEKGNPIGHEGRHTAMAFKKLKRRKFKVHIIRRRK